MKRQDTRSLRRDLIGWAGVITSLVGVGVSVYAAEPDAEAADGTAPDCDSIDPGFARPIGGCPTQRLQDLLATPVGAVLGFGPSSTPSTRR